MKDDKQEKLIFCIIMIIPVIWFALIIAPYISEGIVYGLSDILDALNNPFHIQFCKDSFRSILICLGLYALGLGIYFSSEKNYRLKEEYGSAVWGNVKQLTQKLGNDDYFDNKLFSSIIDNIS